MNRDPQGRFSPRYPLRRARVQEWRRKALSTPQAQRLGLFPAMVDGVESVHQWLERLREQWRQQ